MIAGVCAGLAKYFSIDPTLVRLIFIIAVLAGFGTGLVVYIVLAIVVPEEPEGGYAPPPPPTAPEE
jgi:phage shock protein C